MDPADPIHVQADEWQLLRALANVLLHARIHMRADSSLVVDLSSGEPEQLGQWARIRARYVSAQEDAAALERVFEPAWSGSSEDLHVTYTLVKKMGGMVAALLEGNTVSLEIYLPRAGVMAADTSIEPECPALLIEPNPEIQRGPGYALKEHGYELLEAASCQAGSLMPERSTSIRVLILAAHSEDVEVTIHELRQSDFEPEWLRVDTESEYNAHLGWPPDVILADGNMPLFGASRALELLHQRQLDSIPLIVMCDAAGEDEAIAMLRKGATDYLLKDRVARLGPAVRRSLGETKLRDEVRRAEQALRASDIRFSSFMNNSQTLAFIKDQEGRILYINNTCEKIWGMTLADCIGKTTHQLWPPEVADRLRGNDTAVIERDESSQLVEEVSLRNGRAVPMLTFRFPFVDGDGRRLLGGVPSTSANRSGPKKRCLPRWQPRSCCSRKCITGLRIICRSSPVFCPCRPHRCRTRPLPGRSRTARNACNAWLSCTSD